jgi:hypothetical protein
MCLKLGITHYGNNKGCRKISSFIICIHPKISLGSSNKEAKREDETCSMHRTEEECIQMSIGKPEGKSPLNHECFNTYFKLRGEWSFSCFGDFTPVETALVHTGKEAGWAS